MTHADPTNGNFLIMMNSWLENSTCDTFTKTKHGCQRSEFKQEQINQRDISQTSCLQDQEMRFRITYEI